MPKDGVTGTALFGQTYTARLRDAAHELPLLEPSVPAAAYH